MGEGWNVDVESLPNATAGASHAIFANSDGTRAAVLYASQTVDDDSALLAVYEDYDDPRLILNPAGFVCSYDVDSVNWLTSQFFAVRKYVYQRDADLLGVPFALIDLRHDVYSFIRIDNDESFYLSRSRGQIKLHSYNDEDRLKSTVRQHYATCGLEWRPLDQLGAFDNWYANRVR